MVNTWTCSECGAHCDSGHDHSALECRLNAQEELSLGAYGVYCPDRQCLVFPSSDEAEDNLASIHACLIHAVRYCNYDERVEFLKHYDNALPMIKNLVNALRDTARMRQWRRWLRNDYAQLLRAVRDRYCHIYDGRSRMIIAPITFQRLHDK